MSLFDAIKQSKLPEKRMETFKSFLESSKKEADNVKENDKKISGRLETLESMYSTNTRDTVELENKQKVSISDITLSAHQQLGNNEDVIKSLTVTSPDALLDDLLTYELVRQKDIKLESLYQRSTLEELCKPGRRFEGIDVTQEPLYTLSFHIFPITSFHFHPTRREITIFSQDCTVTSYAFEDDPELPTRTITTLHKPLDLPKSESHNQSNDNTTITELRIPSLHRSLNVLALRLRMGGFSSNVTSPHSRLILPRNSQPFFIKPTNSRLLHPHYITATHYCSSLYSRFDLTRFEEIFKLHTGEMIDSPNDMITEDKAQGLFSPIGVVLVGTSDRKLHLYTDSEERSICTDPDISPHFREICPPFLIIGETPIVNEDPIVSIDTFTRFREVPYNNSDAKTLLEYFSSNLTQVLVCTANGTVTIKRFTDQLVKCERIKAKDYVDVRPTLHRNGRSPVLCGLVHPFFLDRSVLCYRDGLIAVVTMDPTPRFVYEQESFIKAHQNVVSFVAQSRPQFNTVQVNPDKSGRSNTSIGHDSETASGQSMNSVSNRSNKSKTELTIEASRPDIDSVTFLPFIMCTDDGFAYFVDPSSYDSILCVQVVPDSSRHSRPLKLTATWAPTGQSKFSFITCSSDGYVRNNADNTPHLTPLPYTQPEFEQYFPSIPTTLKFYPGVGLLGVGFEDGLVEEFRRCESEFKNGDETVQFKIAHSEFNILTTGEEVGDFGKREKTTGRVQDSTENMLFYDIIEFWTVVNRTLNYDSKAIAHRFQTFDGSSIIELLTISLKLRINRLSSTILSKFEQSTQTNTIVLRNQRRTTFDHDIDRTDSATRRIAMSDQDLRGILADLSTEDQSNVIEPLMALRKLTIHTVGIRERLIQHNAIPILTRHLMCSQDEMITVEILWIFTNIAVLPTDAVHHYFGEDTIRVIFHYTHSASLRVISMVWRFLNNITVFDHDHHDFACILEALGIFDIFVPSLTLLTSRFVEKPAWHIQSLGNTPKSSVLAFPLTVMVLPEYTASPRYLLRTYKNLAVVTKKGVPAEIISFVFQVFVSGCSHCIDDAVNLLLIDIDQLRVITSVLYQVPMPSFFPPHIQTFPHLAISLLSFACDGLSSAYRALTVLTLAQLQHRIVQRRKQTHEMQTDIQSLEGGAFRTTIVTETGRYFDIITKVLLLLGTAMTGTDDVVALYINAGLLPTLGQCLHIIQTIWDDRLALDWSVLVSAQLDAMNETDGKLWRETLKILMSVDCSELATEEELAFELSSSRIQDHGQINIPNTFAKHIQTALQKLSFCFSKIAGGMEQNSWRVLNETFPGFQPSQDFLRFLSNRLLDETSTSFFDDLFVVHNLALHPNEAIFAEIEKSHLLDALFTFKWYRCNHRLADISVDLFLETLSLFLSNAPDPSLILDSVCKDGIKHTLFNLPCSYSDETVQLMGFLQEQLECLQQSRSCPQPSKSIETLSQNKINRFTETEPDTSEMHF
ncbi:hypothetical protein BLNAU_6227 [Blattamonas nauphoetae]|uniref:Uncharacterized protein n=1 Tax=Blattamonas nauphoetae TaxID=2049346 RepID=A0ABQ9Y4T5_9EUKA|nr:hypothetical protein BLNAU_6227 [Blattamonas nauphoetae]